MPKALIFNVFPFGIHEWCARRADGLVCGYFVDRSCAVRFARRETCGSGSINVCDAPQKGALSEAA
jgi:hypothetical protein